MTEKRDAIEAALKRAQEEAAKGFIQKKWEAIKAYFEREPPEEEEEDEWGSDDEEEEEEEDDEESVGSPKARKLTMKQKLKKYKDQVKVKLGLQKKPQDANALFGNLHPPSDSDSDSDEDRPRKKKEEPKPKSNYQLPTIDMTVPLTPEPEGRRKGIALGPASEGSQDASVPPIEGMK